MESKTFVNFGYLKNEPGTFVNFWKLWVRKFKKWNPELYEFLETLAYGNFKNEFKTL